MNGNFWITFFIIFLYYIILDGIMIASYMGNNFGIMIKKIQNGEPMKTRLIPAIICFLILAFGINYFVLDKVRNTHIITDSLKYGLVFGLTVYAVYDLTNYATFKNYTLKTTIIDILWGGTLGFVVTALTKYTITRFSL